jgi:hypothetical protein
MPRLHRVIGRTSMAALLAASAALSAQQAPASSGRPAPEQQRIQGNQRPTDPMVPTIVTTNLPGHPSPPQPQQEQGLDYFAGTWSFSWVGRESPITAGPRSGTATYTRIGQSNFMTVQTEGKADMTGAFKESGIVGWRPDKKILVVHETAANAELMAIGDWSSPIGIRFDTQPLRTQGSTLKLRRTYAIVSATSFTITEELSTDDGPFMRLGVGSFTKK